MKLSAQLLESVYSKTTLYEASIPRKGRKYKFIAIGDSTGHWEVIEHFPFGQMRGKWYATASLSSKNDWRTLSVEGATEHHRGFLKALREMVRTYPELLEWWIQFDGPYMPLSKLVGTPPVKKFDWSKVTFYHGTSLYAWRRGINKHGLEPRDKTGMSAAYGTGVHAAEGRLDAVYLTTQLSMAKSAARDASNNAAKAGHDPGGIILRVQGLDEKHVEPDEDSRETSALKSLEKMGSIAYTATIPPKKISVVKTLFTKPGQFKVGWGSPDDAFAMLSTAKDDDQ